MTFFNIIASIETRKCLAPGLTTFLIGTLCGAGITLVAGLHGNLGMAKIPANKRIDTDATQANTEDLGKAKSEGQVTEGNCKITPPDDEQTSHLLQNMSQSPAMSDVEAERVQLHDLHDLEDYLYQSKPEAACENLHQTNGNESNLPNYTCWCNAPSSRATLTPLLIMIIEYFSELEKIPFNHILASSYTNPELRVARQEILQIRKFLKDVSLSFAIRQGYCEYVSRQIEKTHTIDWDNLKLAITSNRVDIVRLFATSSKLNNNLRYLGLEEAAYQGRMEIMDLFMCDSAVDVSGCNETSPLKAAAAAGQVDAMKKLIQAGADLEARGKRSMLKERDHTPLIAAVARNQPKAVVVLIDAGVMINDEQEPKIAPLRVALEAGLSGIVALLLQYGARTDALGLPYVWADILWLAVRQGHLELAKKALSRGANVNTRIPVFGTLLKHAVTLGDEQMTRLLVDHGANVNHFESSYELGGNCALLAAASCRNTNIFQLLLRHDALIRNAHGAFGNLMQTLAHLGYADHMKALLEMKPDIDVDDAGYSRMSLSPLCMAMNYHLQVRSGIAKAVEGSNHVQVIRLLLGHKAKLVHGKISHVN